MAETRIHHGSKLKYLIEKSSIKVSEILAETGMAKSSLYDLFKKEDLDRATLVKFCTLLKVDIKQFYADILNLAEDPELPYEVLKERTKSLQEMVKAKDVIIIQQQEIIELLKKAKSKTK